MGRWKIKEHQGFGILIPKPIGFINKRNNRLAGGHPPIIFYVGSNVKAQNPDRAEYQQLEKLRTLVSGLATTITGYNTNNYTKWTNSGFYTFSPFIDYIIPNNGNISWDWRNEPKARQYFTNCFKVGSTECWSQLLKISHIHPLYKFECTAIPKTNTKDRDRSGTSCLLPFMASLFAIILVTQQLIPGLVSQVFTYAKDCKQIQASPAVKYSR